MSLSKMIKNMKNTELVITPRLELWLARNSAVVLPEDIVLEHFVPLMTRDDNSKRDGRFGASSRGTCERRQVFNYLGVKPKPGGNGPELNAIFIDGQWRHMRMQATLLAANILSHIEYKVAVPELRLGTSFDGLLQWNGEIMGWELKGTRMLQRIITEGIPDYHQLQIHTMMVASDYTEWPGPINKWVYMAEDKQTQEWKEIVVTRDPVIAARVKSELKRLNEAVDNKQLPDVLEECRNAKSRTFKQCPYSDRCLRTGNWPKEEGVSIGRRRKQAHHNT